MTDRMLIVYSESLLVIVFFSKLLECRLEKKDVGRFSFYTHTHNTTTTKKDNDQN